MSQQIGQRIKQWRELRGWNQEDLARRCNVSKSYIGKLERGEEGYTNPTIETVEAIAQGLKIHPNELLYAGDLNSKESTDSPVKEKSKKIKARLVPVVEETVLEGLNNLSDFTFLSKHAEEWWEAYTKDPHAFYVRIKSLVEGEIKSGDLILIEPNVSLEQGCKILFKNEDKKISIRLYYKEEGRVRLQPLNPENPPSYFKDLKRLNIYRITGKFTKL